MHNNIMGLIKKISISGFISAVLVTHAYSVESAPSSSFNISPGTPLTQQLLDSCWNNREDINNQQVIADYLMTKPSVASDYATSWKTARLVYFIGNYGIGQKRFVDSDDGVKLFDYGVKAGLQAQNLNPNGVEGYYWYAIDLGSYGLAKGVLAAASGAKDGMKALKKAGEIDPTYQGYGSTRILGRYYQELPGLFGGDMKKALTLLKTATTAAPTYRNNWVFLGQYYISNKQWNEANIACQKAISLPATDGKYEEMRYTKEANDCIKKAHD